MNSFMKSLFLWALCLCLGMAARADRTSLSLSVPVLSVRSANGKGALNQIGLLYERSDAKDPLRISITDDMPLGTGDASRAAVWLAAVTAAVARNDPMTGVHLDVRFCGFTDGPSAGGVICLAILSALDGRTLPGDFAMTGTIMPDGTIGLVGGVAQKVRAAVRGGKKRICIPLFSRFEEQDEQVGGGIVDLFRLGRELGVEVRPVANIADVYSYVHGVDVPGVFRGRVGDVLPLDPALEDVLISQYRDFKKALEDWRSGEKQNLPKLYDLESFFGEDFFGRGYEKTFRIGFLASAVDDLSRRVAAWEALKSFGEFRDNTLKQYPVCVKTNDFTKAERKRFAEVVTWMVRDSENRISDSDTEICEMEHVYVPDEVGMSDLGAQLERQGSFVAQATGRMLALEKISPTVEAVEAAGACEDGDADVKLVAWFRLEMLKRFVRAWGQMRVMGEAKMRVPFAKKLPNRAAGKDTEHSATLFRSAWEAVEKAFLAGTVTSLAKKNNASTERVLMAMSSSDESLATYLFDRGHVRQYHAKMEPDFEGTLSNRNYHATAVLYADARVLASACAQLVKYGPEAGLNREDDKSSYANMAFVNYLIRMARHRALRAMAECRRRGIPCPGPQMAFCRAELVHGTEGADPIDAVLRRYWESALGAKALLMTFGNSSDSLPRLPKALSSSR